jgi:Tannase and feruloyl esterase
MVDQPEELSMGKVVAALMVAVLPAGGAYGQAASSGPEACPGLARIELADAKVVSAETVPAGAFTPPASMAPWLAGDPSFYKTLAAFCRAVVKATPSADSDIKIEVWMPAGGWNGKFWGKGNGGFAGEIDFRAMGAALGQGYATAGTDTGHSGGGTDASWALGHPEKVTDFGYRAIHSMTQIAKATIKAFYGSSPQHSYFASCSNGGRQALMEAQRFPEDYDGILAGAPANFWTHLLTKALADAQATTLDPASYISSGKLPAIATAVNAACDAQDGATDGVVNDPRRCPFDPATLLCKDRDSDACLTAPQVTALKKLYEGPHDSRGRLIFPGYVPGAEEGNGGWGPWITGSAPGKSLLFAFGTGYFTNMVYERADWDYRKANIEQALKAAEDKTAQKLDATDANLTAFKARGGKLVLYHGWNDPAISALSTIDYYDSVVSKLGEQETDAFVRLYMVPGMQHCADGPGPNSFGQSGGPPYEPRRNVLMALEQWVEKGRAPSTIVATKYVNDDSAKGALATWPLCPYPQIAKYKGQGDSKDAANFVCARRQ